MLNKLSTKPLNSLLIKIFFIFINSKIQKNILENFKNLFKKYIIFDIIMIDFLFIVFFIF